MIRSNGVPSEHDKELILMFSLGDVVFCRYSSYPYWPATVDQTHQRGFKGRHWAMLRTKSGEDALCFWCTFANEDTGGWVRADRMVMFHPALLDKVRVDKDSEWYADQKEALESALKSFEAMHRGEETKVPRLPADLEHGKYNGKWDATDKDDIVSDDESHPALVDDEDPMDLGDSDEQQDAPASSRRAGRPSKGGKTPARPKAKKEPRKAPKRKSLPAEEPRPKKRSKSSTKLDKDLLDSVDNDPEEPRRKARSRDVEQEVIDKSSGKRRRHSYAHPGEPSKKMRKIEAELATAKETIAGLKRSLKKKEKALAELTGDGAGVACVIPPLPPPIEEPLPGRDKYRSVPVDSKKFGSMMDTLGEDYNSFKKAAESADEARTELEKKMDTIKKLYNEASEKVSVAEEKATKKESDVVRDLREILKADVQVQNLRERKAGHVVRAMLKKCKDLPAIHDFCDAIYKSWKTQVVEYMKENESKLHEESPSGAKSSKSSPDEKSERKNSKTTAEKDKDKEEDSTASPKDKSDKKPTKHEDGEMKDAEAKGNDKKGEAKEVEAKKVKEVKAKEENQKSPTQPSPNVENDKAEKADKAQEAEKESAEKDDEKDAKPDDSKREEKPPKKEASDSPATKKPDSSAKVEDRDRPPAKSGNK